MTGALVVDAEIRRGSFTETIALRADPGAVLAVLGPNGSGKSTLLRAVAGLLPVTVGRIAVGELCLDDSRAATFVPADRRPVGMVFQDYRLFPHLSVRDNVAFAPRTRGMNRADSRAVAVQWLDRLGLTAVATRRPADISGGQAQRVALARALAADPALLLLDEPLAALDARTRLEVQSQLRRHLSDFAGPVLLVTHDPLEALVLADRLVVIEAGRVVQEGAPADIARRPATEYVARLVGLNLWAGVGSGPSVALDGGGAITLGAAAAPGRVLVAVRPSSISVHRTAPEGASARNVWAGRVIGLSLLTDRVRLSIDGAPAALVDVTPAAVAELDLAPGSPVWMSLKATELEVYPAP